MKEYATSDSRKGNRGEGLREQYLRAKRNGEVLNITEAEMDRAARGVPAPAGGSYSETEARIGREMELARREIALRR